MFISEIHFLVNFLLDIIFPASDLAKKLRRMDGEEFSCALGDGRDSIRIVNFTFENEKYACRFLCSYKNPLMHEAIWLFKFRGDQYVTRLLAGALVKVILEECPAGTIIIPIPASKDRIRARGFDQCARLVKGIGEIAGGKFETALDILKKPHATGQQKKMNRAERLQILHGCFTVAAPEKITGRTIAIIDDVITTGATLAEAAKTLRESGVKKVYLYALAH